MKKFLIFFILLFTLLSTAALTDKVQLTREFPDQKFILLLDRDISNTSSPLVGDITQMGTNKFFSVFIYMEKKTGTPNIDLFFKASLDMTSNTLARDLSGTYQILDDFTSSDEWVFTYISPSPCPYGTVYLVPNNTSSWTAHIKVYLYKTGTGS